MMLNSIGNYKRLILALICGSMSYSTFAKVYSWRDADGTMHYSQFPRQIVEKNAAQSRASRKQADMDDVVNDLSSTKASNLLDGLDDIVANASVERQVDKVLTRRDPQLVLIEQQLARQQALLVSTSVPDRNAVANVAMKQPRKTTNKFLAGIQNKLKRQRHIESSPRVVNVEPVAIVKIAPIIQPALLKSIEQKSKPNNAFLSGIKKKLNRNKQTQIIDEPMMIASQNKAAIGGNITANKKLKSPPELVQNKFLAEINKKLFRAHLAKDKSDSTRKSGAVLAKSNIKAASKSSVSATAKNKELIHSADKIKAIESEISSSRSKVNKAPSANKAPSVKQVNSALMLSRLSYNHNARLPLLGASTNQLDRQGIEASSQFVNEVNRNAE